ncbi:MAG: hypothetical protein DCF32_19210 [Leptolyngbya sp.]|nr:MAG: hypothetical protein DCF32_19210 [Leptolyngbya sp.]
MGSLDDEPIISIPTPRVCVCPDSNWGWLGLLGLLGLAGLARRDRPTPVYTTDDRVVDHPSADPRI